MTEKLTGDSCLLAVSIAYISLSEATALNFLAPLGALILTRYLDSGMIALGDAIACAVALASVVLVLQPRSVFGTAVAEGASLSDGVLIDPHASLKGTLAGMVGVVGGVVSTLSSHLASPPGYLLRGPWPLRFPR